MKKNISAMEEANKDYKNFVEEKFNSIHNLIDLRFNMNDKKLDSIEEQTKKTNGRVTKLEDTVKDIQINNIKHTVNCPQNSRFEKLESMITTNKKELDDDLKEYNFIKKYPKIFIGILVVCVCVVLFSYTSYLTYNDNNKIIKQNTELQEQLNKTQKELNELIKDDNKKIKGL